MTRCLVRSEALLTQLLFDQALRIRMKDSIGDEKEDAEQETPAIVVENADAQSEESVSESGKGQPKPSKTAPTAQPDGQGVVGKINVLMAQDIEAVIDGTLTDWRCLTTRSRPCAYVCLRPYSAHHLHVVLVQDSQLEWVLKLRSSSQQVPSSASLRSSSPSQFPDSSQSGRPKSRTTA